MKKVVYVLTVVVMLSSVVAACSYQGDWSGNSKQHDTHKHKH